MVMSQKTVKKWLTATKQKGGKTRKKKQAFPVKPKTPKTTKKVTVPLKPMGYGKKANLHVTINNAEYDIPIRWETEKVDPLIKVGLFVGDTPIFKRYEGAKKTLVWIDAAGKHYDPADVVQKQILKSGKLKEIPKITQTKEITAKPIAKGVMNDFAPEDHVEIWAEQARDMDELRKLAFDLLKGNKVAAVQRFARSAGRKMYVGFIYPVLKPGTDEFTVEMMIAQNKRNRRRWMSAESIAMQREAERKGQVEVEVPKLW